MKSSGRKAFDIDEFMNLVKISNSFEELCMQCDLNMTRCIIKPYEFDDVKSIVMSTGYFSHH